MLALAHGKAGTVLISALLLAQLVLFDLSMNALPQISIFCTSPASSPLGLAFGLVHLLLLGLLLVGLFSLDFVRLRLIYIALVTAALLALAAQATLVSQGTLWCDVF